MQQPRRLVAERGGAVWPLPASFRRTDPGAGAADHTPARMVRQPMGRGDQSARQVRRAARRRSRRPLGDGELGLGDAGHAGQLGHGSEGQRCGEDAGRRQPRHHRRHGPRRRLLSRAIRLRLHLPAGLVGAAARTLRRQGVRGRDPGCLAAAEAGGRSAPSRQPPRTCVRATQWRAPHRRSVPPPARYPRPASPRRSSTSWDIFETHGRRTRS